MGADTADGSGGIVVIAGGVGGARFTRGLVIELARRCPDPATRPRVAAVVNVGDDAWIAGLRLCPDLDSMMYTLAGANDEERGWGRREESERVSAELDAYGVGWPWFTLGDLDLGTLIARTALLREGLNLTAATTRLVERWSREAGAAFPVTLLPSTNESLETHVRVEIDGEPRLLHFEEWWVRYRAVPPAIEFVQLGLAEALPTPEVLTTLREATTVFIAPSNPVVSIGTVLAIPGMREAVLQVSAPIVGVSPIIAGAAVRGMADACLTAIGVETAADAVARNYGARCSGGLLDGWLVAEEDAACAPQLTASGLPTRAVPLWMTNVDLAATLAGDALDLAESLTSTALPRR